MTGSAKQSITTRRKVGLLRRFAPRNDDPNFKRDFAISRREAPEPLLLSLAQRGRGERRMPAAPAASCALRIGKKAHEETSTPQSPDVPARNGFNGFLRALPGDRALLPPSSTD